MMQRVLLSTRRLTYRHGYRSLSTFSRSLAPISSSLSAFQRPHSFAVRSLSLVGEHSLISTQRHHFSSGSDGQPLGKIDLDIDPKAKMQITFTCVKCDTRSSHEMSKLSYTTGVVLIRCPGCKNNHLIADHLGWFEDDGTTIEDIIKAKGGSFQKISDGDFESDPQLVYDHIQALAASSSAEAGEGESESESEARPEK